MRRPSISCSPIFWHNHADGILMLTVRSMEQSLLPLSQEYSAVGINVGTGIPRRQNLSGSRQWFEKSPQAGCQGYSPRKNSPTRRPTRIGRGPQVSSREGLCQPGNIVLPHQARLDAEPAISLCISITMVILPPVFSPVRERLQH